MEFREREGTTFEEAERRYAELERRYDAGQIDEAEFDSERQRLLVRDDEGRWWAKSWESGEWLYHDGGIWIAAHLPEAVASTQREPPRTLAELFAGRVGQVGSGGREGLSEGTGEKFAEHLEAKRRAGHL